jgi:GNAT superfamily N-acetyltransferase
MSTPNTSSTHTFAPSGRPSIPARNFGFDRLQPRARSEVLSHFSGLSHADLALRFSAAVTADALQRYVAALDFDRNVVIAARDESGALLGIVQLMPFASDQGQAAEIAFSVVPRARGRGVGKQLMEHAIDYAREHGVTRLLAQICPDNAPMLAILRSAGMSLAREDGEIVGTMLLERCANRSVPREALRAA